jgi:hypothetical protein
MTPAMPRLTPEQVEAETVKKIIEAIYPILVPWEEQDMAIQQRNHEQIERIARQAWRSFFLETQG